MEDPRIAVIAQVLLGYTGGCVCHEGYTSRNLIDPECSYHIVPSEEAAADIIAALDGVEGEAAELKWNVFLFDPARKYGDHMVTVSARTVAEAEAKALTLHPGSTIAHETLRSDYDPEANVSDLYTWGGLNGIIKG